MGSNDAFTIMSIEGKNDTEVIAGFDYKQLPTTLAGMKAFATAKNLLMDIVDIDPAVAVINAVSSVTALNITTTGAMAAATIGTNYHQKVVTEGGNGPLTFSKTAGSLPAGLLLDSKSGYITGIPTGSAGTSTFTINVIDAFGQTDTQASITITVA